MGCSYCGGEGHNIRSCGIRVQERIDRRQGERRGGRPRRASEVTQGHALEIHSACSLKQLSLLCTPENDCLVHLYWPARQAYFAENLSRLEAEGRWLLVATTGHGVRGSEQPTINFLAADHMFAHGYRTAAVAGGFDHGLMIRRSVLEQLGAEPGYQLADVRVCHPNSCGVDDVDEYWRFDIGKYRVGALHDLCRATVVRLLTPKKLAARKIWIPRSAIVAWW
jgi:hypothetical protein